VAIGDAYATAAEYRAHKRGSLTGDDTEILIALKAMSRLIERRTGRTSTGFNVDAADIKRTFYPVELSEDERTLSIAPLSAAPTTIKIDTDGDGLFNDETALAATDYELLPADALLGPEARPYTEVRLASWGTYATWPQKLRVEVDGLWGWPALPAAIKLATIELAAIYRIETPRATSQISEIGATVETSGEAQAIIQRLIRAYRDPVSNLF
jgi:hypothetical protein